MSNNRIAFDLDDDLHSLLSKEARRREVPIAFLVRAILKRHLSGEEHETKTTLTIRMLREHASNSRIAETLTEQFGSASKGSIAWHRSTLKKNGEDIPSDAAAKERELIASFD